MSSYIEYAIPTSSDYWTHESDEVPAVFIDRIEREVARFVAENWPDVEFTTRRVGETTSAGNRSRAEIDDDDDEGEYALAAIDEWMSTRWPDWLAEAYQ